MNTARVHRTGSATPGFCDLYRAWAGRLKPTLRQVHVAGGRMFVDFAGQTMEVFDGTTGEARQAEVFVAVLGASSYTYAEAVWSQSLPDWISAHVNALAFFGGVPRQIVCDNLRSGITRACFYEPLVNRSYADMARHYGTAVVPARPYKARDKAKFNQLAYLKSGSAFRASLVPPGRTIFLSTIFRLVKGTTTYFVPRPRKPPTDRTA